MAPSTSRRRLKKQRHFHLKRTGTIVGTTNFNFHFLTSNYHSIYSSLISFLVKIKSKFTTKQSQGVTPLVKKYWSQRYNLFSKYDQGVQLNEEGWFSVTPEEIALHHARRTGGGVVIDCFSGIGGNAIQFAFMCQHVVAIDIDPEKVALAFNNAKVYGVEDYIDFIVGDFFQLAPSLKGDVVFLSPPWGGPSYKTIQKFTLDFLRPKDGYSLFQVAQRITPNIMMFLPRNVDVSQVEELAWLSSPPLDVEIEENYVQGYWKGITAYFGNVSFNEQGTRLEEEGWFSVMPEEIAIQHAQRSGGGVAIDCFSGIGSNAIQFATMCQHVVAIDIDPEKVALAYNNAKIYGVEDYIDFVVGDFFQLASSLKGDVVFLSPPRGGPSYELIQKFTLDYLRPKNGYSMFQVAQRITPNIIMFLPQNVDVNQVKELAWLSSPPLDVEIEENFVKGFFKGITAYFGDAFV